MHHLLTPLPLVVAGLMALPATAPAPVVQVPALSVEAAPSGDVYVPIKYVATVTEAEAIARVLDTPRPTEWMEPVRRCARRGGRRFCDGPRMVPMPHGEAAARAEALGLGTIQAVSRLMLARPEQSWIDAIGSKTHGSMHFPVDNGRLGRGVGFVRRAEIRHRHHDGVDIGAAVGATVRAAEDAIVAYADNGVRGYGNLVVLLHPDGSSTYYAHLGAAYVFAGQRVLRGQSIGEVGTTGLSYGPHLHFEWRIAGRPRNPVRRFDEIPPRHPVAPAESPVLVAAR